MLKYLKKGLCKALSMLLAVVMLLTAPIGTMQAYALEGGQPTVTDVQNELPLGVSEGTATDEILDSSTPLEELSPPADSDAPEATPSDAEETGLKRNPAPPPDANGIQNRGMLYGLSAEIGVGTAVELEDAINKLVDGDTIKLTANIDYNKGTVIDGITMTFDVGQYKLNITNSDTSGIGCGLEVKNGGRVTLLYTTGKLNASGHYYGVRANGSSTAALTNATATGENGYGAFAVDNAEITVLGDVEAVKNGSDGVVAWQSSNIRVRGNATGNSLAAKTETSSTIYIEGDATTTGTDPGDVGVFASGNGKITVNGVISVVKPENYVRVNGANFKIDQKILPTTQSGYHTYMHSSYTGGEDSVVWVKQADAPSTVIEVSTAEELEAALGGVTDDGIIKLIANIDYNKGVVMNGKTVNFDVGAYTLNVTNGAGPGLKVEAGGEVRLTGSGKFNAIGTTYGVQADGAGAKAMVTGASGTASGGIGARANNGADITVNGNVWGQSVGAFSGEGGNIIVNGEVKGSIGAEASGEAGCIVITGNVKGTYTYGVKAGYGGKITVHGKVTSDYQDGVYAVQGGEIKVHGDVEGKNGAYVGGDAVGKYGSIHITGNVTGLKGYGVMAIYGGSAIIDGDVTGWKGSGASCSHGNIYVCGNVKGTPSGVSANIKNSTITVKGNVMASLSDDYAVGAEISGVGGMVATGEISGKITIDGEIKSGKDYISINSVIKDGTPGSRDAVSGLGGYYSYSEVNPIPTEASGSVYATSVVFVKAGDMECEIDGRPYATLSEALAAVPSGGTITLLQSITHTKHIRVEKKTINLDLGDHDLLLDTSADGLYSPALMVIDGGKINLIGLGTGEFNVKSHMTAISAVGINTKATVHNVVAGDSTGVNMVGSGDYLDSNSTVTVLGSITVGNGNGVEVNAKDGKVVVGGNITAGRIGVNVWSNPGTQVTVNGDITVDGYSSIAGIWAYGATTVAVTGNVTVRGTDCVGVHASGSTIKVDGNVVSSGKGAHSDTNGKVEITGSLTAGTPFITVGTTEKTAEQGSETGGGSLLYTDGANTVQIGSVGVPTPIYAITIQNDGNGTASANVNSAAQGEEITLTASANGGYRFKEWQIISGDVTVSGNKFTMPAGNVTIKVIFEASSAPSYTVTISGGGTGATGVGNYTEGTTVNIYAGNRSSYTFTGWTSSDVTLTNAINKTASFTMPGKAITVTANWSYNGGDGGGTGGGSGSSSGDSSNIIIIPPAQDKPNTPTQAEIKVDGKVDTSGNLTLAITDKNITDAINKAMAEAKKNGNEANSVTLVVNVSAGGKTVDKVTVNLPKTVQDIIISNKIVSTIVVVDNPNIKIDMDLSTIKEINKQANADVNITATRIDSGKLTGNAKTAIGNRPVFDLKANYGSGKAVQSFGTGSVSVMIPYTLGANEKAGNVQAVYVDAKGKVQWLVSSVYDSVNKVLRFSTNHFSTYGVGYKQDAPDFTDIANHWAKDDIQFVVNRGLFSGTSATTFSPNTSMTRGMFVTALGRLENADVSTYKQSSFTDVKNDAYYMGYIEWAKKNNIVNGIGNGKFYPDQPMSREQMCVIMANYAKEVDFKLTQTNVENTFSDQAKISLWAKDHVKTMHMAGIISGKNSNIFAPQDSISRAEVSTVFRRFIELGEQ